jgi:hypothetical protein
MITDGYVKADAVAWEQALADYEALLLERENAASRSEVELDVLYESIAVAEEKVLAQWAPNAEALIEKLKIIWDDELWSEIDNGAGKRLVLDDVRRLEACCGSPNQTKH